MLAQRINVFTRTRYRDEPAIMAVELGNEMRCPSCVGTSDFMDTVAWMAWVVRKNFPRHLVADGGEGFDGAPALYPGLSHPYVVSGSHGSSFHSLAALPDLDLLSYHFYPKAWGLSLEDDARVWIASHHRIAAQHGKIAYMGEFGAAADGVPVPDPERAMIFDRWLEDMYATTGSLMGLFWQLVPPARGNDGHALSPERDVQSLRVLERFQRRAQGHGS
jgi:mannan endo-1,4-beta-mannosidase